MPVPTPRRVERFAKRHELDAARVEFVENLKEVLRGACEAVARPNDQSIEPTPLGVLQHAVERRAACFRPTKTVVYIFASYAQPTTFSVLAEFPKLGLRILVKGRDSDIKACSLHRFSFDVIKRAP
jgi:hypothetical protein